MSNNNLAVDNKIQEYIRINDEMKNLSLHPKKLKKDKEAIQNFIQNYLEQTGLDKYTLDICTIRIKQRKKHIVKSKDEKKEYFTNILSDLKVDDPEGIYKLT